MGGCYGCAQCEGTAGGGEVGGGPGRRWAGGGGAPTTGQMARAGPAGGPAPRFRECRRPSGTDPILPLADAPGDLWQHRRCIRRRCVFWISKVGSDPQNRLISKVGCGSVNHCLGFHVSSESMAGSTPLGVVVTVCTNFCEFVRHGLMEYARSPMPVVMDGGEMGMGSNGRLPSRDCSIFV